MFFKKQAFKLKDLLKEHGIEIPLVTIQEMLAKSYGFNNRHVALASTDFHEVLSLINKKKEETLKPKVSIEKYTPINELPDYLDRTNINDYHFFCSEADIGRRHVITSSYDDLFIQFFDKILLEQNSLLIFKSDGSWSSPTYVSYSYNTQSKKLVKNNPIKTFLDLKNVPAFFKNFNELSVSSDEIDILLLSCSYWSDIKKILAHKDCPIEILKEYAKDKDFYVRIVALFSQHHRKELSVMAKADPDPRVRRVYYKYLLSETDIEIDELRSMLKKDPQTAKLMRNFSINNDSLVNWIIE